MRRFLKVSAATVAASFALTACSGASGSNAGSDDPLIVYTNSFDSGRGEWLTEQADEAGFDIEIVELGGGDVTNRLLAEKESPVADVTFGLSQFYFNQLVSADTIEPYTPEWAEEVDPEMGDTSGEGNYWPLVQQAVLLTYNADEIDEADAPSDWLDLWNDPTYHGRYEAQTGLGGATIQMVLSGILTRYEDPEGELGISDEGWAEIEKFYEHGEPSLPSVDLFQRIEDGEVDYGPMASSGVPGREEQHGFTAGIVEPPVGTPFLVEQVALVNGSDQVEESQEFIDWFGSAEVQSEWTAEFDSMPVNEGAIEQTDPEVLSLYEDLERQEIDWNFVADNLNAWIEKIELEYVG